jgi:hypothetical protein
MKTEVKVYFIFYISKFWQKKITNLGCTLFCNGV